MYQYLRFLDCQPRHAMFDQNISKIEDLTINYVVILKVLKVLSFCRLLVILDFVLIRMLPYLILIFFKLLECSKRGGR